VARLVEELARVPMPDGHAAQRELPGGRGRRRARRPARASASTATSWQLTEEQDGRRRYRIYGDMPGYEHEDGTDFAAIAARCIAVTPIHFDLTDQAGVGGARRLRPGRLLEPAAREV
jgi:5'-nucleotidase